jgi:hypothetical protein
MKEFNPFDGGRHQYRPPELGLQATYATIAFEFEIFEPHKHKVVTKSDLSGKSLDLVLSESPIMMVSEITGSYAREAITVLIITLSTGRKLYYSKHCWYNDAPDWFSSSKRKKLEDMDYTLFENEGADLYPFWWPEDMIDPLAIIV